MALFDFKCSNCGHIKYDIFMPLDHTEDDYPICCKMQTRKHWTTVPYVAWEDRHLEGGGFRAAHDGTVITSHKQNKDYMRRHGLRLAMDEYEKPTHDTEAAERARAQAAIDAITPSPQELSMLKKSGIVDSDGQLVT
jgi:hypothetical protein